ncbi:MAG: sodium:alanine symporter family protein [Bacteroidetes bacterium]|jgi:AGCS family alanine or glycine:cation symporter|nr:sodium:alanine symporter family protein [Bacteroidota bacterium]
MQNLNDLLATIDGYIGGSPWFVFFLLFTGLFFTLYLGFPQIRYFGRAIRILRGKYDKQGDEGDTSHFQALATALSGTVGTGNIAGVAFAIHLGGPSALFWMLVTAFLGMTTKFVEVTLSHKYREKVSDGTMAGGAMYFMKKADFRLFGKKVNLSWMAAMFAVATIVSSFGTGNLPQINSIANAVSATFGIGHMVTGGVLAVCLGLVIVGGIRRIAKVSEKLVPAMAFIYFFGAISVLIHNYDNILPAIVSVFAHVFNGTAAAGGFLGASVAYAFNRGVNRGLFSNEAGQGSAPIAHASAKAHEPVSEGMVAILEPFIDTIIICSLTGITILASGVWKEKYENAFQFSEITVVEGSLQESTDLDRLYAHFNGGEQLSRYTGLVHIDNGTLPQGITILHARSVASDVRVLQDANDPKPFTGDLHIQQGDVSNNSGIQITGKSLVHSAPLTSIAFSKGLFGQSGAYIVTIALLLFAFSTAISWSYYGDRAVIFLLGAKWVLPYRLLYVLGFFLASFTDTQLIWTFSGIAIALMTIPNLIGILWLRKEVKTTINSYRDEFI